MFLFSCSFEKNWLTIQNFVFISRVSCRISSLYLTFCYSFIYQLSNLQSSLCFSLCPNHGTLLLETCYVGARSLSDIASNSSSRFTWVWLSGHLQFRWLEFRHGRFVGSIWTSRSPTWRVLLPRPSRTVLWWTSCRWFHRYLLILQFLLLSNSSKVVHYISLAQSIRRCSMKKGEILASLSISDNSPLGFSPWV